MKNNLIIYSIGMLIILFINFLINMPIEMFIVGFSIIALMVLVSLTKRMGLFFVISIIYIYYFIFLLLEGNFNIFSIITGLLLICYYVYCCKYTFNILNNKMNISFTNLKIPDNKESLVIKYLKGPLNDINVNGIVVKEKNSFVLYTENKEKEVNKYEILINDIDSIVVEEKPYFKSVNMFYNYETDYLKSVNIGKFTGNFDDFKGKKVIASYYITITLKDNTTINIISFNKPNIFK